MYLDFIAQVHYWKLPSKFLGDKVTSYGGRLNYTVRYVPLPSTGRTSSDKLPDVELRVRFSHFIRPLSPSLLPWIVTGKWHSAVPLLPRVDYVNAARLRLHRHQREWMAARRRSFGRSRASSHGTGWSRPHSHQSDVFSPHPGNRVSSSLS